MPLNLNMFSTLFKLIQLEFAEQYFANDPVIKANLDNQLNALLQANPEVVTIFPGLVPTPPPPTTSLALPPPSVTITPPPTT